VSATQQFLAMPGAELRRDLSQFFTPPELAVRLWDWAVHRSKVPRPRILEPSAGRGALLRAAFESEHPPAHAVAYDVDPDNVAVLRELAERYPIDVIEGDFLASEIDVEDGFHFALMNPPFEDGQDVAFIEHACKRSPCAFSVAQARIEFSEGRSEFWAWHDAPNKVVLETRPRFGGHSQGMTDFVLLHTLRRHRRRERGETMPQAVQRWA